LTYPTTTNDPPIKQVDAESVHYFDPVIGYTNFNRGNPIKSRPEGYASINLLNTTLFPSLNNKHCTQRIYFFHCGCKEIFSTRQVHTSCEALLNSIVAKKEVITLYEEILRRIFAKTQNERITRMKLLTVKSKKIIHEFAGQLK
jgi:hypothetical protein